MATNECEYGNERGKTTGGKKEMGMIDGKQDSQCGQEVTNKQRSWGFCRTLGILTIPRRWIKSNDLLRFGIHSKALILLGSGFRDPWPMTWPSHGSYCRKICTSWVEAWDCGDNSAKIPGEDWLEAFLVFRREPERRHDINEDTKISK